MDTQEFLKIKEGDIVFCSKNIENGPKKNWIGKIIHKCNNDTVVYWDKQIDNDIYFNFEEIARYSGLPNNSTSTFFINNAEIYIEAILRARETSKPYLRIDSLSLTEVEKQLEFEF